MTDSKGKDTGRKERITKRSIDALRSDAQVRARTLYLRDTETTGFGAVATKTGACSYFVEYRLGGRGTTQKRVTLGKHGVLTPEQARGIAKEELGKVARGTDVAQAKKDERAKLTGLTFAEAVDRYLSLHARPTRYWRQKATRLGSSDTKAFRTRPIALITRGHIAAAIDEVEKRSVSAARALFSDIRPSSPGRSTAP
ncbi:hypothetical protein T281_01585 [Rhodomicrobium udaipurense JA643]|uniref:DUF4102 domain-containing protein n=1 Tax=Rhodomicrobium udaipurense TaxID=1202716 RepID=A0A8I1GH64_9HYPH|nr:Arm DNA-binding domain-containing protein [Rhodomicrobium udaipurense]KAI96142.1 hypothetical protein T281_01585 [Rhodomicrobium udaipurense JA643]MBJ7545179.1 DUF4102 domain-containing protein [Rhodomicrobium udaipurense]